MSRYFSSNLEDLCLLLRMLPYGDLLWAIRHRNLLLCPRLECLLIRRDVGGRGGVR